MAATQQYYNPDGSVNDFHGLWRALNAVSRHADWKWAITSEDEWYKAAYYSSATGSYYDYPTSSDSVPGRDLDDASGNNANYRGDPFPIDSPYYTTVVGQFQNSTSPYGTFDQGGNVWEWNEAIVGSYRGVRGGAYIGHDSYLLASVRDNVIGGLPPGEYSSLGFRVCEVPEPGTMALLAFGGIAGAVLAKGAGKIALCPSVSSTVCPGRIEAQRHKGTKGWLLAVLTDGARSCGLNLWFSWCLGALVVPMPCPGNSQATLKGPASRCHPG